MKKIFKSQIKSACFIALMCIGQQANATLFTSTSPSGLDVTTVGASTVGGIVIDLIGTNGTQVVSQIAGNTLFIGNPTSSPYTVGSQSGFNTSMMNVFGGGFQSAAFRFTIFDGDTGLGDFDRNDLTLFVNGISFADFNSVTTQNTDIGGLVGPSGINTDKGFREDTLDTGWFYSTNSTTLLALFNTLPGPLTFTVTDADNPSGNYIDYTRGINNSLAPLAISAVPEPETYSMFIAGLALLGFASRRKQA